jgi:enoyl-CoA hydratase/carnithine racemase
MFTGRVVSGAESVILGLANECVPDDELKDRAVELAADIVKNSWHTLRADKALVNAGLNHHLREGLEYERENSPGAGPDMAERLAAFGK